MAINEIGGCGCGCSGHGGCGPNCTCNKKALDEMLTKYYCYRITIATEGAVPCLEQFASDSMDNLKMLKDWNVTEVAGEKAEYCMHVFCASELPKEVSTSIAVFGYTICKKDADGNWVELVSGLNHNPAESYKPRVIIHGTPWAIKAVADLNKVIYIEFNKVEVVEK